MSWVLVPVWRAYHGVQRSHCTILYHTVLYCTIYVAAFRRGPTLESGGGGGGGFCTAAHLTVGPVTVWRGFHGEQRSLCVALLWLCMGPGCRSLCCGLTTGSNALTGLLSRGAPPPGTCFWVGVLLPSQCKVYKGAIYVLTTGCNGASALALRRYAGVKL